MAINSILYQESETWTRQKVTAVQFVAAAVPGTGEDAAFSSFQQQQWTTGWDLFDEPLGTKSKVIWTHTNGTNSIHVKYVLRGARPFHDYQAGLHFFWGSDPAHVPNCLSTFGQFRTFHGGVPPFDSGCDFATRQDVVAAGQWVQNLELGVLHTDKNGNGAFIATIKDVNAGVYSTEFTVREGVGCYPPLEGNFAHCGVVFQSPGPLGKTTIIHIQ